jgi:hypothetical protein
VYVILPEAAVGDDFVAPFFLGSANSLTGEELPDPMISVRFLDEPVLAEDKRFGMLVIGEIVQE